MKYVKTFEQFSFLNESIGIMDYGPGTFIYGLEHGDIKQAVRVIEHAKSNFSTEKKIVFVGEGGDPNNVYPVGSETEYIYTKLKEVFPNLENDSWDGKDFDVTNPDSFIFEEIQKLTGFDPKKVSAGVYAGMVGQGQDPTEVKKLLTDEGIEFLISFGVKDPVEPSVEDIQLMYDLCFPQDTGAPSQEISTITDAFNKARDLNLIRKIQEYQRKDYQVIACAGKSHLELIDILNKG